MVVIVENVDAVVVDDPKPNRWFWLSWKYFFRKSIKVDAFSVEAFSVEAVAEVEATFEEEEEAVGIPALFPWEWVG